MQFHRIQRTNVCRIRAQFHVCLSPRSSPHPPRIDHQGIPNDPEALPNRARFGAARSSCPARRFAHGLSWRLGSRWRKRVAVVKFSLPAGRFWAAWEKVGKTGGASRGSWPFLAGAHFKVHFGGRFWCEIGDRFGSPRGPPRSAIQIALRQTPP